LTKRARSPGLTIAREGTTTASTLSAGMP
jgi:hypothetical protein